MSTNRERWRKYLLEQRDESMCVTMFNVPTTDMDRDELLATIDRLYKDLEHYRSSFFGATKRMFDGYK